VSCDLAILSTEERSRRGYGAPPPWPEQAGLVELTVGDVRKQESDVTHDPVRSPRNYSHTIFSTALTQSKAKQLVRAARIKIPHRVR
jgi:hypothetical protein